MNVAQQGHMRASAMRSDEIRVNSDKKCGVHYVLGSLAIPVLSDIAMTVPRNSHGSPAITTMQTVPRYCKCSWSRVPSLGSQRDRPGPPSDAALARGHCGNILHQR